MIIIKSKKYPFRDRIPEWIISGALLVWGLILFLFPDIFIYSTGLRALLTVAPQSAWGLVTVLIGLFRLAALITEKFTVKSAHLRATGALAGVIVWGTFFALSLLNIPDRVSGIPIYAIPFLLDFLNLWWASGEAKLADQLAKGNSKHGST